MKYIYELINNCIKYHKVGSKHYCETARLLLYIINKRHMDVPGELLEYFITKNSVESVGDYLSFIILYIEIYGVTNPITECVEILLQNQILGLALEDKKYIEDELNFLKRRNICNRLVYRILMQIQGVPDQYSKFVKVYPYEDIEKAESYKQYHF